MKILSSSLLAAGLCLGLAACDRPAPTVTSATPLPEPVAQTKTLETSRLGKAVDLFETRPTAENRASVDKALADLDGEIAELEQRVARTDGDDRREAAAKLKNLQSYRSAESLRFTAAQAKAPVTRATEPVDDRSGEEKIKDSARKVGDSVEDAAKNVGDAIKDAVK